MPDLIVICQNRFYLPQKRHKLYKRHGKKKKTKEKEYKPTAAAAAAAAAIHGCERNEFLFKRKEFYAHTLALTHMHTHVRNA